MKEYEKLLKLTEDSTVELATSFKDLLHKKLALGQTRYVCRYGTLSDGHEKITDAQRYFQAIKEMYYLGNNIRSMKAQAMLAHADLMDAQKKLKWAWTRAAKLRAEANIIQAQDRMVSALVTVEDQMRMLDEYNQIRQELEPIVEHQYPEGIEQAEPDNWKAVARYRLMKNSRGERLDNIPLPPEEKARIGIENGRFDAAAPLRVVNPERAEKIFVEVQEKEKLEAMERERLALPSHVKMVEPCVLLSRE